MKINEDKKYNNVNKKCLSFLKKQLKYNNLPTSYSIPIDDPYFNAFSSKIWLYDIGLLLLVFSNEEDFKICNDILLSLESFQNEDGSFNFSYDINIKNQSDKLVRTGAIGWLVWGICYYILKSNDYTYKNMVKKIGEWLLSQQILDKNDLRYGLLKGGYCSKYETVWCSIEHNCSSLQGLQGLYLVLEDERYKSAYDLIGETLISKCYNPLEHRFYQGVTSNGYDKNWALDCTTWTGLSALSLGEYEIAHKCLNTAKNNFLVTNKRVLLNKNLHSYNSKYWTNNCVDGFKPYISKIYPSYIWTEGTLGYVSLALKLGKISEAKKYIDFCIDLQNCNNSSGGLIYATETIDFSPLDSHVWESVAATCWLYLVINNNDIIFNKIIS